jgi:hypothetical protein
MQLSPDAFATGSADFEVLNIRSIITIIVTTGKIGSSLSYHYHPIKSIYS